jgi:hypothetical protein
MSMKAGNLNEAFKPSKKVCGRQKLAFDTSKNLNQTNKCRKQHRNIFRIKWLQIFKQQAATLSLHACVRKALIAFIPWMVISTYLPDAVK